MLSPVQSLASKTTLLRQLIESSELEFLMEAHNGLSARIVEEAGFKAIWGSGLSISAALGVRDSNEATWTQVLEVLEFMSDATSIPILVDGDTGYGDFNTMRRLVRKLESRNVAGVCIEDKCFPKTNSFINGTSQPLANIDEFCGKIKAGRDAQNDDHFVIVARVEAFIAGWGLSEAMKRASAYAEAGADAILMHSAQRNPDEVFSFLEVWENRLPVILVPTKYFTTPTQEYADRNVSAVIWANHNLRSCITAMRRTCETIARDQHLQDVESRVAPVAEVFRLQGADELADAERKYLPEVATKTKAIVLAYTQGEEMGELTSDKPKAMVNVGDKPILQHITDALNEAGVRDINVVRGYCGESVNIASTTLFDSPTHSRRAEVLALSSAREAITGDVILSYGDVLFKPFLITQLLDDQSDFSVLVDTDWKTSRNRDRYADYAVCSHDASRAGFYQRVTLKGITHEVGPEQDHPTVHGEWMGFLRMSPRGSEIVCDLMDEVMRTDSEAPMQSFDIPALLNLLVERGNIVDVIYTTGNWLDCDSIADAVEGGGFAQ